MQKKFAYNFFSPSPWEYKCFGVEICSDVADGQQLIIYFEVLNSFI